MKNIKYSILFKALDGLKLYREELSKALSNFFNKHGKYINDKKDIEPDSEVVINWACIWNQPKRVGSKATIVMSTDVISIVAFDKDGDIDLYRNIDLSIPKEYSSLSPWVKTK